MGYTICLGPNTSAFNLWKYESKCKCCYVNIWNSPFAILCNKDRRVNKESWPRVQLQAGGDLSSCNGLSSGNAYGAESRLYIGPSHKSIFLTGSDSVIEWNAIYSSLLNNYPMACHTESHKPSSLFSRRILNGNISASFKAQIKQYHPFAWQSFFMVEISLKVMPYAPFTNNVLYMYVHMDVCKFCM